MGRDPVGEARMCESVLDFLRERMRQGDALPDFVFITGDIGFSGDASHYTIFREHFYEPLLEACGKEMASRVYIVPGNHDVNRATNRYADTYSALSIEETALDPTGPGAEARSDFARRFEEFVQGDPSNRAPAWLPSAGGVIADVHDIEDWRVGVLGLNTAWLSRSDEDREKLTPGKELVKSGLDRLGDCEVVIALGHHPPDWFTVSERKPILAQFAKRPLVYLCGHRHRNESLWYSAAGFPVVGMQAGAVFYDRAQSLRSGFLKCSLVESDTDGAGIEVQPFKWNPEDLEWRTDSDAFPNCYQMAGRQGCWRIPYDGSARPEHLIPDHSREEPDSFDLERQAARATSSEDLKQYVMLRDSDEYVRSSFQAVLGETILSDPVVSPSSSTDLLDCLCTVISRGGCVTAIFPDLSGSIGIESVGRTTMAMNLLGLEIPYGDFFGASAEEWTGLAEDIPIRTSPEENYRLIAADMAYLGVIDGALFAVPVKGERLYFAWDLARNLFRGTDMRYVSGSHRTEAGRERLHSIFRRIALGNIRDRFADQSHLYEVNRLVVVRSSLSVRPETCDVKSLDSDEARVAVQDALMSRNYHQSPFWAGDNLGVEQAARQIAESISWDKINEVFQLTIRHSSLRLPKYVLDEAARCVDTGEPIARQETFGPTAGSGVRHHNDVLFKSLGDIDVIRLVAISGAKVFADMSFWAHIVDRDTPLKLVVLLLDPDSEAAAAWQQIAYTDDKGEGFLVAEIRENIRALKRVHQLLKVENPNVTVELHIHDAVPTFRMTLLGRESALVTSYRPDQRTGSGTSFYHVDSRTDADMFAGFARMFDDIYEAATPIDLDA